MNILLVAATTFEIRPFLDKLSLAGQPGAQFSRYQYKGNNIDVLIPGIGMVSTAYYLGKQLALQRYDLAINAGIAGSFNRSLPPGTVVNIAVDCIPELGAEDGDAFLSIFELGLTDPDAPPYKAGKLVNETAEGGSPAGKKILGKLPKVIGITSNIVRGNSESIARIHRLAPADTESMEGAAFFYACISENVPCLQIRSVSNYVEERDKSNWKLDLALKNLNNWLWEFLIDIY